MLLGQRGGRELLQGPGAFGDADAAADTSFDVVGAAADVRAERALEIFISITGGKEKDYKALLLVVRESSPMSVPVLYQAFTDIATASWSGVHDRTLDVQVKGFAVVAYTYSLSPTAAPRAKNLTLDLSQFAGSPDAVAVVENKEDSFQMNYSGSLVAQLRLGPSSPFVTIKHLSFTYEMAALVSFWSPAWSPLWLPTNSSTVEIKLDFDKEVTFDETGVVVTNGTLLLLSQFSSLSYTALISHQTRDIEVLASREPIRVKVEVLGRGRVAPASLVYTYDPFPPEGVWSLGSWSPQTQRSNGTLQVLLSFFYF